MSRGKFSPLAVKLQVYMIPDRPWRLSWLWVGVSDPRLAVSTPVIKSRSNNEFSITHYIPHMIYLYFIIIILLYCPSWLSVVVIEPRRCSSFHTLNCRSPIWNLNNLIINITTHFYYIITLFYNFILFWFIIMLLHYLLLYITI